MEIKYNTLTPLEQFDFIRIKEGHQKAFFKAHRHDFFEMIYIIDGHGAHSIDFKKYHLKKDTIHLIQPSQIHEWLLDEFNNEYDGYIFRFSKELLPITHSLDKLFNFYTVPLIELTEPIKSKIDSLIMMIEDENINSQNNIVRLLFCTMLEYISKIKKENNSVSVKDTRIPKLLELIEKSYITEKSASFYAISLDLTTKRLNELSKKYLNKTISTLIVNRNIIEAKRKLFYSDLSIKELSEFLGFNDTSHFVKFFKKHTSYTPMEFKNLLKDL